MLHAPTTQMQCPSCGSHHVHRVKVAYEMGTTTSQHAGMAGGMSLGGSGSQPIFAGHSGSSVNQTAIAERLAPPKKTYARKQLKSGLLLLASGLMFFLMASPILSYSMRGGLVGGGILLFFMILPGAQIIWGIKLLSTLPDGRKKDEAALSLLEQWDKRWVCHACKETFEPRKQP